MLQFQDRSRRNRVNPCASLVLSVHVLVPVNVGTSSDASWDIEIDDFPEQHQRAARPSGLTARTAFLVVGRGIAEADTAAPQPGQQAQLDALQQQIRDLQRAAAMDPVAADAPRTQQPS